jgi:hypothetical protein
MPTGSKLWRMKFRHSGKENRLSFGSFHEVSLKQIGRNYMHHTTTTVYATFDKKVEMYKGTTMAGIIVDEARFDTKRGFADDYHMETISLGLPFYAAFLNPCARGADFARAMDAYAYTAGMWIVGEDMPRVTNRITLNRRERSIRLAGGERAFRRSPER